jgi:hypothetical protein
MVAAAALILIALIILLFRTCGPRTRGPIESGPGEDRLSVPDGTADRALLRTKKSPRAETVPIDEDRDLPAGSPRYEGPVDLGTQVEMLTK